MRPLTRTLALAATSAVALALTAGPAQATTLNPTKLTRGADPAIATVEGKTLVDGALRVTVPGREVTLLGESGTGYVVARVDRRYRGELLRIEADGTSRSFGEGDPYSSILSSDGKSVVAARYKRSGAYTLKVIDATSGAVTGRKSFPDYPNVLDVAGSRVYLGGFSGKTQGTFAWDTATGAVTKLSRRVGFRVDAAHDLLASYTRDPYLGGCTVLTRLSDPATRLWRSCKDTIAAFSTDGSHVATYDILTDGLGAGEVRVRTQSGAVTGEYQTKRRGYFGTLEFEDADTLLLETTAKEKTALVRCTAGACDLASDVRKAEPYRMAG